MDTLLDLIETQANTQPTPAPSSYPYPVPVRVDGAQKLCVLARRCVSATTLDDIQSALQDVLAPADG